MVKSMNIAHKWRITRSRRERVIRRGERKKRAAHKRTQSLRSFMAYFPGCRFYLRVETPANSLDDFSTRTTHIHNFRAKNSVPTNGMRFLENHRTIQRILNSLPGKFIVRSVSERGLSLFLCVFVCARAYMRIICT